MYKVAKWLVWVWYIYKHIHLVPIKGPGFEHNFRFNKET